MKAVRGICCQSLVYNGDNPLHLPIPESFVAIFRLPFRWGFLQEFTPGIIGTEIRQ